MSLMTEGCFVRPPPGGGRGAGANHQCKNLMYRTMATSCGNQKQRLTFASIDCPKADLADDLLQWRKPETKLRYGAASKFQLINGFGGAT